MPGPRRVRLGPTAWALVVEAAAAVGMDVDRLPTVPDDPDGPHGPDGPGGPDGPDDRAEVRAELVRAGVMLEDGRLSRTVHGGLAVLTTAPVAVTVDQVGADRRVQGVWRTLGIPTAGLLIRDVTAGDGRTQRDLELQVLAGDDLVGVVTAVAGPDDADPDHLASGPVDLPVATGADGRLPEPLDEVAVDGQVALRAVLGVTGPGGTVDAQLIGDGRRWWQVGAVAADQVRWVPVDGPTVRGALVSALAAQLTAGTEGAGER